MKVYKFGGASVKTAEGVKNLCRIISGEEEVFVIVSAMGKTTNAMEAVTNLFMDGDRRGAQLAFAQTEKYHLDIIRELTQGGRMPSVNDLIGEVKNLLDSGEPHGHEYDMWYDRIVSYGELLSTTIISEYLAGEGIKNRWLDMRRYFITDSRHRDANIDIEASCPLLKKAVGESTEKVFIGQGFIGGTPTGSTTTLGREGSDYSAAMAAYLLDAQSVTIWKDVPGILNADPKFFSDTHHIPRMTYLDAIELAYSGAQIIHPKTIKPLQNKNIPLYVRPFSDITGQGSVITDSIPEPVDVPVLILKHNQVLLSVRPTDFSFVLEDRYAAIFGLLEKHNVKINLIQSSAVNLSICVDASRKLPQVMEELKKQQYRVVYNDCLELLTIRGYDRSLFSRYADVPGVMLCQRTRRILRIVRRAAEC